MTTNNKYLLVTHIPFARDAAGQPVTDALWVRDLIGLAESVGSVRVAAPEVSESRLTTWGPSAAHFPAYVNIEFRGFPNLKSRRDLWKWPSIRAILREEVKAAELVHTSHLFQPWLGLGYAHDLAVKLGKKTLFVVAEDFRDVQTWEWIRGSKGLTRWSRERKLNAIEDRVRKSASTASLTFLHTPAAVERYRLCTKRSVAIRQPGHTVDEVISALMLNARLESLREDRPLRLVSACRHVGLKGLDMLVRAVSLLKDRGIAVSATLYGGGPESDALRKLVASQGVGDCIEMPGPLAAGSELNQALRQADLFLMPHRTTDFGRAFFDAMAAGLPVLAFRTPASIDTVYEGQDGFLAPLDDIHGLAERIASLHRNRSQLAAASLGARSRALENTRAEWFRLRAEWTMSLLNEQEFSRAA